MNNNTTGLNASPSAMDLPLPRKIPVGRRREPEKQTTIAVEKHGETVSEIKISCRCGEEITVHCTYPESDRR